MCKCMGIPYFIFTSASEFIDNVKKIIESMQKKIETVGKIDYNVCVDK